MPLLLCVLLAAATAALAPNGADTWSSSGTTAAWGGTGAAGNWTGVNTPPISGDSLIFDVDNSVGQATTPVADSLIDNLTVGGTNSWTFANITFTGNAPAYTITSGTAGGQGPGGESGSTPAVLYIGAIVPLHSSGLRRQLDCWTQGVIRQNGGVSVWVPMPRQNIMSS
jgi:hypothetical protein